MESSKITDPSSIKEHYQSINDFSKVLLDVIFNPSRRSIIKDFPHAGINFVDINEFFIEPELYSNIIKNLSKIVDLLPQTDVIIATEARGFLIGSVVAAMKNIPFIPVRKKGKLPHGETLDGQTVLNYCFNSGTEYSVQDLCISSKAVQKMKDIMIEKNEPSVMKELEESIVYSFDGDKLNRIEFAEPFDSEHGDLVKPVNVLLIDDLLATGQTFKSINDFLLGLWGNLHEDNRFYRKPSTLETPRKLSNEQLFINNTPIKIHVSAALSVVDLGLKPDHFSFFDFKNQNFENDQDGLIKSYSLVTLPENIQEEFNNYQL